MTYTISLTAKAKDDLLGIFGYVSNDLQSPQTAAGQLARLEKGIASLEQMPERFRVYDKGPWRNRNLSIMPVDNYIVFYIPNHDEAVRRERMGVAHERKGNILQDHKQRQAFLKSCVLYGDTRRLHGDNLNSQIIL